MNWFVIEYFCICYDNVRWVKVKKKKYLVEKFRIESLWYMLKLVSLKYI